MKAPVVRVTCRYHPGRTLAKIEATAEGAPYVTTWTRNPIRTARTKGGRREPELKDRVEVMLEDERADRWIATGMTLLSWCPDYRAEHPLPLEWLRSKAHMSGAMSCPCAVL